MCLPTAVAKQQQLCSELFCFHAMSLGVPGVLECLSHFFTQHSWLTGWPVLTGADWLSCLALFSLLLRCPCLQLPNSSNSSYSMRQIYQKFLLPYEDYEQDRLRREAMGSQPPELAPTAEAAAEPAAAEADLTTPAAAAPPLELTAQPSDQKRSRKEGSAARRAASKKAAAGSKRDRSLEAEEDFEEPDDDEEDKPAKKKKKKVRSCCKPLSKASTTLA